MKRQITCLAPGKINLTLTVLGRLTKGYHLINSVVCPISLGDRIELEVMEHETGVSIECSFAPELNKHHKAAVLRSPKLAQDLHDLDMESNLAVRAVREFLAAHGLEARFGVRITILKRIPLQAGLGGGSSDAAAVLRGLAVLFDKDFGDAEMLRIAASLGSDVPVMLYDRLLFMHGTGRKLAFLECAPGSGLWSGIEHLGLVLIKPPVGVDTAQAYASLGFAPEIEEVYSDLEDPTAFQPVEDAVRLNRELCQMGLRLAEVDQNDPSGKENLTFSSQDGSSGLPGFTSATRHLVRGFGNDFERVVFSRYPQLARLRTILERNGAERVLLAGSGSAMFAFVSSRDQAGDLVEVLSKEASEGCFVAEVGLKPEGVGRQEHPGAVCGL